MNNYNNKNYINKKGKIQTVIAACLATVVFGCVVGFGGSQLLIMVAEVMSESGYVAPRSSSSDDDIDRSNLPSVFGAENERNSNAAPDYDPRDSVATHGSATGETYTPTELYRNLKDTIVGIKLGYSGGFSEDTEIIGSGVIISEDGFIITCEHVIKGADKVIVVVDDYDDPNAEPHEYDAIVYGEDYPTDLAVIKIARDEPFRFATIGSSSDLEIGDPVAAIGNPVGLMKTMTQGIVSGLNRDLGDNSYMLPSIQTDAALNPGNSGCPLFNMRGEIVGIVNSKIVYSGEIDNLGFAISIDEAMPIIEELANHGAITSRPMLGIHGSPISTYYGSEYDGLLVESVRQGSPAAESGLARNDIIIKIDGQEVASVEDIQRIIKAKNIGDSVTVTVVRYNNYGESSELDISFALSGAE